METIILQSLWGYELITKYTQESGTYFYVDNCTLAFTLAYIRNLSPEINRISGIRSREKSRLSKLISL